MSNQNLSGTSPRDTPEYRKYRADYEAYLNDYYYRYLPELDAYNRSVQQYDAVVRRRRVVGAVVAVLAMIGVTSNNSNSSENESRGETPSMVSISEAEMASLNSFWDEQSQRLTGREMSDPTLVQSSSPNCSGETYGGSYCPRDATIFIDYVELAELADYIRDSVPEVAPSDEAVAFVVGAHEYGHHVQYELGIIPSGSSNSERLADCFAGASVRRTGSVGRDVLAVVSYSFGDDDPLSPHQTGAVRSSDSLAGFDYGVDACFNL